MAKNNNLSKAKKAKNDEFYTRLEDIEREVFHYKKHFAGKVVYCNCDDPAESNFFKYFALNIKAFQLKKLIATCYDGSCIADTQLSLFDYENEDEKTTKHAHKIELVPEDFDTTQITMDLVRKTIEEKHLIHKLKGNGDFRSEECIELLKEADIVCTNPPFSLFREYVAQLVEYNKKFLILGNNNAITYKEIFPLIKGNMNEEKEILENIYFRYIHLKFSLMYIRTLYNPVYIKEIPNLRWCVISSYCCNFYITICSFFGSGKNTFDALSKNNSEIKELINTCINNISFDDLKYKRNKIYAHFNELIDEKIFNEVLSKSDNIFFNIENLINKILKNLNIPLSEFSYYDDEVFNEIDKEINKMHKFSFSYKEIEHQNKLKEILKSKDLKI